MQRQLDDRIETYDAIIEGNCTCGQPIIKVIGSSCSGWINDKTRYHYPGETSAYNIFRCKKCLNVIEDAFTENKPELCNCTKKIRYGIKYTIQNNVTHVKK